MTSDAASFELPVRGGWADWAGMVASIGCAVHCAAMPLVLAYLPALGLGWVASQGFQRWMAVVCFGLAAAAFVPGWRKHRSFAPAIWGGFGLLLLTTAAFGLEDGCCSLCTSEDQTASAAVGSGCGGCCERGDLETPPNATLSVASLTPFVTPLGGLFLVVGHIVNHINSCRCRGVVCCLTDNDATQT